MIRFSSSKFCQLSITSSPLSTISENLVVMVDNQSILLKTRDSWWVGEGTPGERTFGSSPTSSPDILRMVIGRLWIRSESLNEVADDLEDLGRTIGPEHDVWTTHSNHMVFSCPMIDGQKSVRMSTWNQSVSVSRWTECVWVQEDSTLTTTRFLSLSISHNRVASTPSPLPSPLYTTFQPFPDPTSVWETSISSSSRSLSFTTLTPSVFLPPWISLYLL